MAITTENQKRAFIDLYPTGSGTLDTSDELFQMIGIVAFGVVIVAASYDPPNFILKLATLEHILTLSLDDYILLMEDQDHDLKIH